MSERKINLEEILFKHLSKAKEILPNENWYSDEEIKNSPEFSFFKDAMKEACQQTLELVADNAECKLRNKIECSNFQLENGFVVGNYAIVINKQLILDTINQIE